MTTLDPRTAAWLADQRFALNTRLEALRQRFPRVAAERLLGAVRDHLPAQLAAVEASVPEDQQTTVLLALFDILTLHAARDTLARPAIARLLDDVLLQPAVLRLVARAPRRLPAALSNGVERMGTTGPAWLAAISEVAPACTSAEGLLTAGALCAWRLGEPRIRHSALEAATTLPPRALLAALGLGDWPERAARLVLLALQRDGWLRPSETLGPRALEALASSGAELDDAEVARWTDGLGLRTADAALEAWVEVGRVGAFAGFGGRFVRPPLVVAVASPHLLYVAVDTDAFRLDADIFGAVATPIPLAEVPGLGDDAPTTRPAPAHLRATVDRLARAGAAAGATSMQAGPGAVAWTSRDSHRIRVLLPPRQSSEALR